MRTQDLHGHWELVSLTVKTPGGDVFPMGPNPTGRGTYGADGTVSVVLLAGDRPRFAHDAIARRSADEAARAFDTSIAYYGTYFVDLERREIVHTIERSTFPNLDGVEMKRGVELDGDRLVLTSQVLLPDGSWARSENVFRRRKG